MSAAGLLRRIHAAVASFAAPGIVFFALSGVLQTYDLNEQRNGVAPPAIVEKMAQAHKRQHFALRPPRPSPPRAFAPGPAKPAAPPSRDADRTAAKALVAAISVAMILSAVAGAVMALTQRRGRSLNLALLVLGAVLPAILFA